MSREQINECTKQLDVIFKAIKNFSNAGSTIENGYLYSWYGSGEEDDLDTSKSTLVHQRG